MTRLPDDKLQAIILRNYDALRRLTPSPRDMSAYKFLRQSGPAVAEQLAKALNHSAAYSEIIMAKLIESGWVEQRGKHYFAITPDDEPLTFEAWLERDPILKVLAARKPEVRHAMRSAWDAKS